MSEERLIICRNCGQSLLDDGDESMVWRHADGSRWCRDGRPAEPYGYWPDYRKADSKSGEPRTEPPCGEPEADASYDFFAAGPSSPDVNDPAPITCGHGRAKGCCDVDDCVHSPKVERRLAEWYDHILNLEGMDEMDGKVKPDIERNFKVWQSITKGSRAVYDYLRKLSAPPHISDPAPTVDLREEARKCLNALLDLVDEHLSDIGFSGAIYHYHWRDKNKAMAELEKFSAHILGQKGKA